MPWHCFNDKIFVLSEEEETTTLASFLMLLVLFDFENLQPIHLWFNRLHNFNIVDIINISDNLLDKRAFVVQT